MRFKETIISRLGSASLKKWSSPALMKSGLLDSIITSMVTKLSNQKKESLVLKAKVKPECCQKLKRSPFSPKVTVFKMIMDGLSSTLVLLTGGCSSLEKLRMLGSFLGNLRLKTLYSIKLNQTSPLFLEAIMIQMRDGVKILFKVEIASIMLSSLNKELLMVKR